MKLAYVRAFGLRDPGAMRSLAAFVAEREPDVLAICEIDAGDAFALATRFSRQWAYRGAQALFWSEAFVAHAVHDVYLPFALQRPFDRRGLLRVDADHGGEPVALFATQFSAERRIAVPELRFARAQMRRSERRLLAFAQMPRRGVGIQGRGVETLAYDEESGLRVCARGFAASSVERGRYSVMVVCDSQGMPPPQ